MPDNKCDPSGGDKIIKPIKQFSQRCGKSDCPHYDKTNSESKCSIYSNRNECSLSRKQAKRNSRKSKLYAATHILGMY